jgi:hypothetical protein
MSIEPVLEARAQCVPDIAKIGPRQDRGLVLDKTATIDRAFGKCRELNIDERQKPAEYYPLLHLLIGRRTPPYLELSSGGSGEFDGIFEMLIGEIFPAPARPGREVAQELKEASYRYADRVLREDVRRVAADRGHEHERFCRWVQTVPIFLPENVGKL